jgi:hypothetical protein
LMPGGVVEGRHPSNEGRKPGPDPWGAFHPQGRPRRQRGGGPGLGLSPTGKRPPRKGSISRNLRGVEPRRKGEDQKDPRGRGLPAGIPEAQPAAPGLMGG